MELVPDWIRPAFSDFRDYVHDRATDYQKTNPRPRPQALRRYLAGFFRAISDPLDLAQQGSIAAGYYLPLPDRVNRWTAGLPSAGSVIVGEGIVWGSAFTATAGGLTVAIVSETLDVYAIASARTQRYRWAQLAPGPAVVRSDVTAILDATGQRFAKGTLGQLGLGTLATHVASRVVSDLAVPVYGAYQGGRSTRAALRRAFEEPLSAVPEQGAPPEPDLSGSPPASFFDWFQREGVQDGLAPRPGEIGP
jgi:hypothetical protein